MKLTHPDLAGFELDDWGSEYGLPYTASGKMDGKGVELYFRDQKVFLRLSNTRVRVRKPWEYGEDVPRLTFDELKTLLAELVPELRRKVADIWSQPGVSEIINYLEGLEALEVRLAELPMDHHPEAPWALRAVESPRRWQLLMDWAHSRWMEHNCNYEDLDDALWG